MKRPSTLCGKKCALKFPRYPFFLFIFGLFALAQACAEPPLKVVGGRVKEISSEEGRLTLSYFHPATGRDEELVLTVDSHTGFSEGVTLGDLRRNDPLSVDYEENEEGRVLAVQIKRVPLRGIPIDKKKSPLL